MPKLHKDETLTIRSMGRSLRVTAIFADDAEANAYMARHADEGVIAVISGFVFLANVHDRGEK